MEPNKEDEIDLHIKVPRSGRILITAVTSDDGHSRIHQFKIPLWLDKFIDLLKVWAETASREVSAFRETSHSTWILIGIGLVLFLGSRIINLEDFPPGFYSDEVVNAVRASDLIRDGFHDYDHNFLPTFFVNDAKFTLGTTVYLQIIPHLLFGYDIFFVRLVSVLLAALASLWMALTIIRSYKLSYGWTAIFILASTPAWFMYSRLAFETIAAACFYMGFLHYYLRYRLENRRYIYPSMICAALSFYSYFPAQIVIPLTYLAFFVMEFSFHRQEWRRTLYSHGLLLLLMIPLVRFLFQHPESYGDLLERYNSSLAGDTGWINRILILFGNYLQGLNPFYWFNPSPKVSAWWMMEPYGYLPLLLLPFFLFGLYFLIREIKRPEMRLLMTAWLIAPIGAALIGVEITRLLMTIIPITIISTIGLSRFLESLQNFKLKPIWIEVISATFLTIATILLTWNALINGPAWKLDYGIGGIQWGAKQVFSKALGLHEEFPHKTIRISGGWTWQADTHKLFFLPKDTPIQTGNADIFLNQYLPNLNDTIFILIPEDYQRAASSQVISKFIIDEVIPYPNGEPGFYVTRLEYSPDAEQIFAASFQEKIKLIEEEIRWLGQNVVVRHSRILDGSIERIFDADAGTYMNTEKINPLVIEVDYAEPVLMKGMTVVLGSEEEHVTIELTTPSGNFTFNEEFQASNGIKTDFLDFGKSYEITNFRYIQQDPNAIPEAIMHLWEISPIQ